MTLTLLDLYNSAATQEWAMYDNDATNGAEMEPSLILALNKSILEILSNYDFSFRARTHLILTQPNIDTYDLPQGLIIKDSNGKYLVQYNGVTLDYAQDGANLSENSGAPSKFYLKNNNIVFSPKPTTRGMATVEYYTLAIGEDINGEEIFALKNPTDKLCVPNHLEELMRQAVISRAILNTIASESDENYSAYKKQADKSLKLLIKYSKGVGLDKKMKI